MANFSNANFKEDKNGNIIVTYDFQDGNGNVTKNNEINLYLENGDLNPEANKILLESKKQQYMDKSKSNFESKKASIKKNIKKDAAKANKNVSSVAVPVDENLTNAENVANTENEVDEENVDVNGAPEVSDVNKGWFKKHGKTVVKFALTVGVLFAVFSKIDACSQKKNDNTATNKIAAENMLKDDEQNINQQITETPTPVVTEEPHYDVEGTVEYIDYDKCCTDMEKIGKEWKKMGLKNVSQESLNSLYFATNYNMMEQDTIKKLYEKNVVPNNPMMVITDSIEALSVCSDEGSKYAAGGDGKIIDLTMFCVDKEDKKVVKYAYDSLHKMRDAKSKDEAQDEFNSYYHYLYNEKSSKFPVLYNEANKGVNFLMNQGYGPIFCVAGGQNCVDGQKLREVETDSPMNDFASVIREMENCTSFYDNDMYKDIELKTK